MHLSLLAIIADAFFGCRNPVIFIFIQAASSANSKKKKYQRVYQSQLPLANDHKHCTIFWKKNQEKTPKPRNRNLFKSWSCFLLLLAATSYTIIITLWFYFRLCGLLPHFCRVFGCFDTEKCKDAAGDFLLGQCSWLKPPSCQTAQSPHTGWLGSVIGNHNKNVL